MANRMRKAGAATKAAGYGAIVAGANVALGHKQHAKARSVMTPGYMNKTGHSASYATKMSSSHNRVGNIHYGTAAVAAAGAGYVGYKAYKSYKGSHPNTRNAKTGVRTSSPHGVRTGSRVPKKR